MKNSLILGIASIIFTSSVYAGSNYGSAGLSVVNTDDIDGSGIGLLLKAGHLFGESKNAFGVEVEVNPMRVDKEENNNYGTYYNGYGYGYRGNYNNSSSGMGGSDFSVTIGTSLIYNYKISNTGFTIRPKIGVLFPNIGEDIYKDSTTFSYGASAIYNFAGVDAYISYDSFGSGANRYSLGLTFKF